MKFRVNLPFNNAVPDTNVKASSRIRSTPLHKIVKAHNPAMGSITRQLTLNESASALGPLELVVNNSKFNLTGLDPSCTTTACRETEIPQVGDTEIWEIINISADAHPMHTHLTSFQVLDRTPFDAAAYLAVYDAALLGSGHGDGEGPPYQYNNLNADGAIGGNPAIGPYLNPLLTRPPLNYELGWKDTVIAYPGEVTRIAIRWAPTDIAVGAETPGINQYVGFNPTNLVADPNDPSGLTKNVGYVWHCHIVDHEDNEMMRNYTVGSARQLVVPNGAF
jgi:spore coat protein A